ncbi:hypothetical protein KCV87_23390 [Actinosynnema pretiosum subsp. pretiosum]|uniref:Uncharacterized protein n=1 Tax=Actinosynnema pretiosum subsp. pretiosum TaxID=103721 RepID=A0AA45L2R6_9PSEU|nr:Serine/threonine kinase [Actinosynnema pretiosum subsp. pretiosum]QUF02409.1 hypothetical protein KCV87_23390 [Actinosynnema pretiosum subsp. pretiosum]
MSNEDNRRRRDYSDDRLSVAELIARSEAETVRFTPVSAPVAPRAEQTARLPQKARSRLNLSGRELHITELLRREGRPADDSATGRGVSVPKLVAMASGGVVLTGAVAFSASQWMSAPDERPLAEVRFDDRQAARSPGSLTADLVGASRDSQDQVEETETEAPATTETTRQSTAQEQPRQQQQQQTQRQQQTQQRSGGGNQQQPTTPTTNPQQQTSAPTTPVTSPSQPSQPSTQPSTSTPAPPPTSGTTTPPSSATAPPPASGSATPAPTSGVDLGIDLGKVLEPVGGFDFFAPAP